jgi:hypothetical protein
MRAAYRCALALAALAGLLGASPTTRADERILSFDSTITVNRDGTLEVSEAIRVRAEGKNIRRGIYRDFPTIYPRAGGGQVTVGFAFQSAKRDGTSEPWHAENLGNGIRVYVGSPSRHRLARRTYLCAGVSHRPADGLLLRPRRVVLERHRQRLGLPHRPRFGARVAARRDPAQ